MISLEAINTLLALLAIAVSVYSIFWQRPLHKITKELQESQLADMRRTDQERMRARVTLELVKVSSGNYRFVLHNVGKSPAHKVNFSLRLDRGKESPLALNEVREKLPVSHMPPGSRVQLVASISSSTQIAYDATVVWTNPDASAGEESVSV